MSNFLNLEVSRTQPVHSVNVGVSGTSFAPGDEEKTAFLRHQGVTFIKLGSLMSIICGKNKISDKVCA